MAYSYTERKRIRKSFGTRETVLAIPYLLQMQKDAYTAFLQANLAPRKNVHLEGLQAAFDAAFPIVSHNGFVEMKFIRVQPGQARVRRPRMPDPWPDVCVGRARQGSADHL
jgi:DNA-directed RNA polymerase beta subunit